MRQSGSAAAPFAPGWASHFLAGCRDADQCAYPTINKVGVAQRRVGAVAFANVTAGLSPLRRQASPFVAKRTSART